MELPGDLGLLSPRLTHIRSMLLELELRDRTQLVIAAYESGFTQRSG